MQLIQGFPMVTFTGTHFANWRWMTKCVDISFYKFYTTVNSFIPLCIFLYVIYSIIMTERRCYTIFWFYILNTRMLFKHAHRNKILVDLICLDCGINTLVLQILCMSTFHTEAHSNTKTCVRAKNYPIKT